MKKILNILFFTLLILLGVSCSDDVSRIENKWQLCKYEYADGVVQREDSVFYNFMKGSFSAICLLSDGNYKTFWGNYSLEGNELKIQILSGFETEPAFEHYLNWENGSRIFKVDEISSSALQLSYKEEKLVFRKY
ncbi:lipocalin-like domain-containing protein [uncultured Bacteroides sp.]|uniref:lipocalin-like domain-containing protein n=1 Tax=uncultured Bacteroides sp. TaxID=162156 RepID=UPI002AAC1478|nr:lipocalin-like domain-containing protein [uncultured Bacteroides sp.]